MQTNPGSPDAKRLGCSCPVLDNAYGAGAVIDGQVNSFSFYLDPDCPIHQDKRGLDAGAGGEGTGRRLVTEEEISRVDRSDDTPASSESDTPRAGGSAQEV